MLRKNNYTFCIVFLSTMVMLVLFMTSIADADANSINTSQIDKGLVKGKTTKANVQAQFGAPNSDQTANGISTWIYIYQEQPGTPSLLSHVATNVAVAGTGVAMGTALGALATSGAGTTGAIIGAGAISGASSSILSGVTSAIRGNDEPQYKQLTINFDKKGIVRDYSFVSVSK
jgi:outer membrane protein assembly factor BamE (lipoprotein component of BamABCDE complex)